MTLTDRSPQVNDVQPVSNTSQPQTAAGLRLLFVVDSKFPGLGGAESQAIKLAYALRSRGASVDFVTPRVLTSQLMYEEFDGFSIQRIDYPHIKFFGSAVMMYRFGRYLIKQGGKYDCMHIHVTRLLTATAGFVRHRTGLPIVTKISGFFEFEGGVLDQRKRFNPINALMRIAMRNVDHVQTISRETRCKLLAAGFREAQIALIPNGIDTSTLPPPMPESRVFTIGYCGRLREVKGVHVLLDGFHHLRRTRPDVPLRLLLAGSGETEPELRAQATRLGILDDIVFLGLIEETAGFYADLDLYVQPSFAEGLPNSVIEAMHAAKAVLATNIGGNQDLIEEGKSGRFFAAGDSAHLGKLLVESYDDQAANIVMGEYGRSVIENQYGMDCVVDKLVEVYRAQ